MVTEADGNIRSADYHWLSPLWFDADESLIVEFDVKTPSVTLRNITLDFDDHEYTYYSGGSSGYYYYNPSSNHVYASISADGAWEWATGTSGSGEMGPGRRDLPLRVGLRERHRRRDHLRGQGHRRHRGGPSIKPRLSARLRRALGREAGLRRRVRVARGHRGRWRISSADYHWLSPLWFDADGSLIVEFDVKTPSVTLGNITWTSTTTNTPTTVAVVAVTTTTTPARTMSTRPSRPTGLGSGPPGLPGAGRWEPGGEDLPLRVGLRERHRRRDHLRGRGHRRHRGGPGIKPRLSARLRRALGREAGLRGRVRVARGHRGRCHISSADYHWLSPLWFVRTGASSSSST